MRALAVYTDGVTTRYGGVPNIDQRYDAEWVLRDCGRNADVVPVRVETVGMPWTMWVDERSLEPTDETFRRNYAASILPTEYGAAPVLTYGPVAITSTLGIDCLAVSWDALDTLIEDITRAVHGLHVAPRHGHSWWQSVRDVADRVGQMRRQPTLRRVGG